MSWLFIIWLLAVLAVCYFVFSSIFEFISASDLENDYINPIDMADRMNMLLYPDVGLHALITVLFLFSGYWFEFLFNIPLLAYYGYLFMNNNHRLDATTILQGDRITVEKRKALIKLGFYLICFFLYLYRYAIDIPTFEKETQIRSELERIAKEIQFKN